jgi:hypothetical protein
MKARASVFALLLLAVAAIWHMAAMGLIAIGAQNEYVGAIAMAPLFLLAVCGGLVLVIGTLFGVISGLWALAGTILSLFRVGPLICLLVITLCTPALAQQWEPAHITRTADGREWYHNGTAWVEVTRTQCQGGQCQPNAIYYRPVPQQQPREWSQPAPITAVPNASNGVALLPWRDQMERKIAALEAKCAQAGARGPTGPPGPQGPAGPPGTATNIDANALALQITQAVSQQLEGRLSALEAAQNKPFHLRVSPDSPYQAVRPGNYVTLPLEKLQTQ